MVIFSTRDVELIDWVLPIFEEAMEQIHLKISQNFHLHPIKAFLTNKD